MPSVTRLSSECQKCPFSSKCAKKKMQAEEYVEPNLAMPCGMPVSAEMVQPMAAKHDYRGIWIDEDKTVTIDLEELKKQLNKEKYKELAIGLYPGA